MSQYTLVTVRTPGWDAGARSVYELRGDGYYTFTVGQHTGVICGLNSVDTGAGYVEIDHAFSIENGLYRVIEGGSRKTGSFYCNGTEVFKIERIQGVVRYYLDDVFVYQSLVPSTGTVFLDASLYSFGDTVPTYTVEELVSAALVLSPLVAGGGDAANYGICTLLPLTVEGAAQDPINVAISLQRLLAVGADSSDFGAASLLPLTAIGGLPEPRMALLPLTAFGNDPSYSGAALVLPPLEAVGYEFYEVPEVNIADIALSPLTVWGYEDTSDSVGALILEPLLGLGLDDNSPFADLELRPLEVSGFVQQENYFQLLMPLFITVMMRQTHIEMPSPILESEGTVSVTGGRLKLPEPVVTVYGGAITALRMPSPILTTATTQIGFATVAVTLPEPILTATGFSGIGATATLEMPDPLLTAQGGAVAVLEAESPVLVATGTVTQLATVALQMPLPDLSATGTVAGIGRVAITLPEPLFYAGIGNHVALEVPMVVLTSSGRVSASVAQNAAAAAHAAAIIAQAAAQAALGTPGEAAALEAEAVALAAAVAAQAEVETTYAVNLSTGAVTTLLLGGFDKLVSAHGRLYGLKDGALTRLEGEVDGTDTPIPVTIRFAPSTFGTNFVKRMPALYLSMREYDGVTLELVADEIKTWRYRTNTDTAPAYGTHRFSLGAGVKFHTAGLILKNRNGGKFSLGGLDPLVEVLSRRPR